MFITLLVVCCHYHFVQCTNIITLLLEMHGVQR